MGKKVLFLALWFLPRIGGMEMSSFEIVKMLQKNGHEVCVVTADEPGAADFDRRQSFLICRATGMDLYRLSIEGSKTKINRIWHYIQYYRQFYRVVRTAIRQLQPDEVIVADEQTRNWYGFYTHKIPYHPIIVASMPVETSGQRLKIYMVNRTLRAAKGIYCVSQFTREALCAVFGEAYRNKMHVLYRNVSNDYVERPVRTERVAQLRERYHLEGKFVLLTVCRLSVSKGVEDILKAMHLLDTHAQQVVLLIAGQGPDRERLEHMVQFYGLIDRVMFCGAVDKDEILDYYDTCDLFVLPTRQESFGRVFVEAGARHKTSIGCAVGGVPEIIEDRVNGRLVEPEQAEQLGEAILELMENPEMRRAMETKMYAKVRQNFTFDALAAQWKTILS